MSDLLELRNVSKEFHGVLAIEDITFTLRAGEVHSLLGENGAGKSTLSKIAAGVHAPTRGDILINGEKVVFSGPIEALAAGVAMVFQETSLIPTLTVAQNIFLGHEKVFNRLRPLYIAAQQFLQSLKFPVDPTAYVSQLGAAQKQMVEIARAVIHKAKVIIFDEPTATLTPEEKAHFFTLVKRIKSQGTAIVFISHALEEALDLSDRITIMRDGRHIITADASGFDRDKIVRHMVGRELTNEIYGKASARRMLRPAGRRVLSVQNLTMGSMVKNMSFSVYSGQITGVFGLVGAGRTEAMKVVSGVVKRAFFHGGKVILDDQDVRYRIPRSAVKSGISYITEDRKAEGMFDNMSIDRNIYISQMAADLEEDWFVNDAALKRVADKWRERLQIRTINRSARVIELSGGNQQKVVIAKALVQNPRIVIFDEPTRGVDVGAIAEIHRLMNSLADEGLAIIMVSSYLPEIIGVSDRILVARQGRIVEEFNPNDASEEKIMYAAIH